MYLATQTFWLEPTDRVAVGLRRYFRPKDAKGWDCQGGYHSKLVYIEERPAQYRPRDPGDPGRGQTLDTLPSLPESDPRWPVYCTCGFPFPEDAAYQMWQEPIYRRADTNAEVLLRSNPGDDSYGDYAPPSPAGPGACWNAWWMPESWRGPDGIALMVKLPNGMDWHVDGKASNCTRTAPEDQHKCWIRTGTPQLANVTAGKDGDTCSAGAGSVQAGDYHGFLQNGVLTAG